WLAAAALTPSRLQRPLAPTHLPAGFPSPAADFAAKPLDLNELLIAQADATFFWRVRGHSMSGAGILDGDILVVDRAVQARHGMVVVAALDGEFTVKRLYRQAHDTRLQAAHPDYPDICPKPGQELLIWGVVRASITPFLAPR